ncbi:MAG TPA: transcriptional regulator [Bacteroidia bacterium]|nr:transcriptional regulator [Bacteroidia bacterium]
MKPLLEGFNKAFENRTRLAIMSVLVVNNAVDFNTLKETLQVTDGNLASHITALEKAKYLEVRKGFIGRKTNTTYVATREGIKAFKDHLDSLEQFIKDID